MKTLTVNVNKTFNITTSDNKINCSVYCQFLKNSTCMLTKQKLELDITKEELRTKYCLENEVM
jgi:hypothetical protein